ncbi:MAG: BRO family protein [Clostridium sp.]|uniref:BRO-N domain-containing protein n=1 Tax=Clostridium sp. TaxID=1506 RepID=UPI002908BB68|nr:BRO family protein [Clostridium sp.]MDU5010636.1 BRO family protein [Clostridium botulinum]MDU5117204.1 BRO family protein [Clostridium botulinum]MDU7251322.1 BRO family protein [Clostridium sp.]
MNNLQIFKNQEFGMVRMTEINNKPYAVANDVLKALGYAEGSWRTTLSRKCKGVTKCNWLKVNGVEVNLIPEGDIYRLITGSHLPSAEKFEVWVFDEVLPTIRKTGGYVASEDLFINTYLPYLDEQSKMVFRNTLETVRKQNEIIALKEKEIEHKEDVIVGLVDEISLAEKRQILNRVVRYKGANYRERWNELYKQFEMKYHIESIKNKLEKYNKIHKPKLKSKVDYIDKVMNKIPELYEIACKLYENDVRELAKNLYSLNEEAI